MANTPPIKRIIISRTDSIGDVVLTLPLCIWLRKHFPTSSLVYLCSSYTRSVVECFSPIHQIILLEDLEAMTKKERNKALEADVILHVFPNQKIAQWAKGAKIPQRIGTSHRWNHWIYCNVRVDFSRKNSSMNEAQLNFYLLKPLGLSQIPAFSSLLNVSDDFRVQNIQAISENYVVLHPLSKGSAVDYPLEKYVELAKLLVEKGFKVVVTGTSAESDRIGDRFENLPGVINGVARFSLQELMELIKHSKGIVACSTGPLHLAGAMNVRLVGLYSSRKPIDAGRWSPLGTQTRCLEFNKDCRQCDQKTACTCIEKIPVEQIFQALVS